MANMSWLNFLLPGVGSLIDAKSNNKDGDENGALTFIKGLFNPFYTTDPDSEGLGSTIGSSLGQGLGQGLSSFVDSFLDGAIGKQIKEGSGDPDYTAATLLGDLFTGGAVSANKETRKNNAWQREFAENERDYQRNTIDPFNMNIENENLALQNRSIANQEASLAHQISMDEFNKNVALNGRQIAVADAQKAGLNPLALDGAGASLVNSSVSGSGSVGSSNSISSNSPSAPSFGQMATFSPLQNMLLSGLGALTQMKAVDNQIDISQKNASTIAFNADTDRLKALLDAKKAGYYVGDDLQSFNRDTESWFSKDRDQGIYERNREYFLDKNQNRAQRDYWYFLNELHNEMKTNLYAENRRNQEKHQERYTWKLFDLLGGLLKR